MPSERDTETIDAFGPESWAKVDAGTAADGEHHEVHTVPVRAHKRTVKGPPPKGGEERKRTALDKHVDETAKSYALVYIRNELRKLWLERDRALSADAAGVLRAIVNADDAWEILHAWADCPQEVRDLKTNAFLGAVFKQGWVHVGYTKSRRDNANGRTIHTWRPTSTP